MKILLLVVSVSLVLAGCITASQPDRRAASAKRSAAPVMLGIGH